MNTTSTTTTESQAPAAWWQAFYESEATVVNQYVWGARPGHRDELILRDRVTTQASSETSSEPPEPDERLWSLMDYYDPTSAVNTEGEVVERYRFSAFGLRSILAPDFSPRAVSHYDWDFAFKGQFLDVDTGYYNYGYRYYSPELGRWLSRDPIGEEGGTNLYGLIGNRSINALDRLGLVQAGFNYCSRCRYTGQAQIRTRTDVEWLLFFASLLGGNGEGGNNGSPVVITWTEKGCFCPADCGYGRYIYELQYWSRVGVSKAGSTPGLPVGLNTLTEAAYLTLKADLAIVAEDFDVLCSNQCAVLARDQDIRY